MQKCTGITFLHVGRVHYYIRDNTPNGDTNTDNTNIDYDEAFENMHDNPQEHAQIL